VIRRQGRIITAQFHSDLRHETKGNFIKEVDLLHPGHELVVPIRSPADNAKDEVDLGGSLQVQNLATAHDDIPADR
jgi:hypothetical protein